MSFFDRLRSCINGRDSETGRTMTAWLGAGLVLGLLAVGCGDDADDVEGDFGTAQMRLEASSSNNNIGDQINFTDSDGTLYTLTSARLVIQQIELDLPDDLDCDDVEGQLESPVTCDEGTLDVGTDELQIEGPFVVDLTDGTTTPDLGAIDIPALDYDEIDVEVDSLDEDDDVLASGDDLIAHTFVGEADFEFENQKRELFTQFSFQTEATADDINLALDDGEVLVVQFNVANWLQEIPVTSCLQGGDLKAQDGRVTVDDEVGGECENAEERFEENFADSIDVIVEEQDQIQ